MTETADGRAGPMTAFLLREPHGPFTFNENVYVSDDLLAKAREQDERMAALARENERLAEWASVLGGMILEYHDRSHGSSVEVCAATLCRQYVAEVACAALSSTDGGAANNAGRAHGTAS